MALNLCKLELKKLRKYLIPQRKPCIPTSVELDEFVVLTSNFVHQLCEAGMGPLIISRTDRWKNLTCIGTNLDQSRHDVLLRFSRIEPRQKVTTVLIATLIQRLENHDDLVWNLKKAREDTDLCLAQEPDADIREILVPWLARMRSIINEDDREHYFGAYLLRELHDLRDADQHSDERRKVCARFANNFENLVNITKAAAEFLLHSAKEYTQPPLANEIGIDAIQAAAETSFHATKQHPQPHACEIGAGCHSPDEPVPRDRYPHGPLHGNQKTLASLICPYAGRTSSTPRALRDLGAKKLIWIVMHQVQTIEVYFADAVLWANANAAFLKLKEENFAEEARLKIAKRNEENEALAERARREKIIKSKKSKK